MSSSMHNAISATASAFLSQADRRFEVVRVPSSLNASTSSWRDRLSAGANPKSSPLAADSSSIAARTRASILTSWYTV